MEAVDTTLCVILMLYLCYLSYFVPLKDALHMCKTQYFVSYCSVVAHVHIKHSPELYSLIMKFTAMHHTVAALPAVKVVESIILS